MNKSRVFITGISALTACGPSIDQTWSALLDGQSAICPIQAWDLSTWPCHQGAEIDTSNLIKTLPDRKLSKVISKQDVLGIHAAMQAINDSSILTYRADLERYTEELKDSTNANANANAKVIDFNERTGIYVGSPGNKYLQQYDFLPLMAKSENNMQVFAEELFSEVHPMWLLRILPNNVLAYTGISYGFKGPNHNITNHAVGGMQAIIEAWHAIQVGQIDRAVVVAYDIAPEPQGIYYYEKLGVLSQQSLKPFDFQHDGTILGEGASAIVLESEASVQARKATAYAELVAGASASEQKGLFGIDSEGLALSEFLTDLFNAYSIQTDDLEMIVAHGNGNPLSDITEAKAINQLNANAVPVTAFKWAFGHTIAASGVLDTALAIKALKERCIPGIANFERAAEDCRHLNISAHHRTLNTNFNKNKDTLLINRGFAGMNAALVIRTLS